MNKLSSYLKDFRDQVKAATNPRKPEILKEVIGGYRDGIGSLIPALSADPLMAAMAFHQQIRFVTPRVANEISERDTVLTGDWPALKESVTLRIEAHAAVKTLEDAGLQDILVFAFVMNYKLNGAGRIEEEEDQSEPEPETQHEE
jgi:hypothetical protein